MVAIIANPPQRREHQTKIDDMVAAYELIPSEWPDATTSGRSWREEEANKTKRRRRLGKIGIGSREELECGGKRKRSEWEKIGNEEIKGGCGHRRPSAARGAGSQGD
jgi:hypothetical protein